MCLFNPPSSPGFQRIVPSPLFASRTFPPSPWPHFLPPRTNAGQPGCHESRRGGGGTCLFDCELVWRRREEVVGQSFQAWLLLLPRPLLLLLHGSGGIFKAPFCLAVWHQRKEEKRGMKTGLLLLLLLLPLLLPPLPPPYLFFHAARPRHR